MKTWAVRALFLTVKIVFDSLDVIRYNACHVKYDARYIGLDMVTQNTIAVELGISRSSVACAFHPTLHKYVSPHKRQQILDTAKQLGFVPNHAARRLARKRSDSRTASFDQVGLIYLQSNDSYVDAACLAMMRGAEHDLSNLQASLVFVRVGNQGDWAKVDRLMRAGGVDGWLLVGTVNDEVVNRLKPGKLPFVILGDHRCTQPVHCVNVDHFAAGRLAAQHLTSLGHRRIAFLYGGMQFLYEQETLQGFRATLKELGLDDDERLIANGPLSWSDPQSGSCMEWLRSTDPTALFTPEIDWATNVYGMLQQSQMDVPKDISLLAYEIGASAVKGRSFTRIELPLTEVGCQGAFLIHKIASGLSVESSEIRISPSLIEGWSTCPPSNQGGLRASGVISTKATMENKGHKK